MDQIQEDLSNVDNNTSSMNQINPIINKSSTEIENNDTNEDKMPSNILYESNSEHEDSSPDDNNEMSDNSNDILDAIQIEDFEMLGQSKVRVHRPKLKYKKLNYLSIERSIDKNYFNTNHRLSCSLDILASYLKGQKIIYMESKYHCETRLNFSMMPAILFSTLATYFQV